MKDETKELRRVVIQLSKEVRRLEKELKLARKAHNEACAKLRISEKAND